MNQSGLDEIRVLDLSGEIAGAYCGQLFAAYGADVVLVEPPGGHPLRHQGPCLDPAQPLETSLPFLCYQRGKQSAILDCASPEGKARLRDLVASADLVLESWAPAESARLGLDFATLLTWNPSLILVSVTAFGQTGSYRNFLAEEIVLEALSGQLFATGSPGREPLCSGPPITQVTGGFHAFLGALMALRLRRQDGQGRHVDVSNLEAGLENMELRAYPSWRFGKNPTRVDLARPTVVPWGAYPCRDGWAAIHGAPFRRWRSFGELLLGGRPLTALYAGNVERMENSASPEAGSLQGSPSVRRLRQLSLAYLDWAVRRWTAPLTRQEILATARDRSLAFGSLRTLPEILDLPQHQARGFFTALDHPVAGRLRYPLSPFPAPGLRSSPAPCLGEHTNLTWKPRLDPGASSSQPLGNHPGPLPLAGLRILDLTTVEAAPHGTRILADFGAEVLRIEYPNRLDLFRGSSLRDEAYNRQPLWAQLNRNKRSLTLDLKSSAGREALFRLVETSDAVVTNFRSGTLDRLGLGYEALQARRPGIIALSMSGYGGGGPDSGLPAYGGAIEVMSGVQNLTAYPGGKPQRIREIDVLNGIAGAAALMVALTHRDRTGQGQWIDLSQMEATTHALMGEALLACQTAHPLPPPAGNRRPGVSPRGCYPCLGEDRWVALAIRDQKEWTALALAISQPEWAIDPRFATPEVRDLQEAQIRDAISAWTRLRSPGEAMAALQAAGIPAGAVWDFAEVRQDPHLRDRAWFLPADPSDPASPCFMGFPFRISGVEPPLPHPGPALGEANAAILRPLLGPAADALIPIDPTTLGSAFRLDSR